LTKFPYLPYKDPGAAYFWIDAYYPAANEVYKRTLALADDLNAAGLAAARYTEYGLKDLAVKAGLADRVRRNTLAYGGRDGSRFCIGAVRIGAGNGARYADARNEERGGSARPNRAETDCGRCGACARACPTGAIAESGFDRGLCLRQHMADGAYPDAETARAAGRRLWGCDACQSCCPDNPAETVEMPAELRDLLKIDGFIGNASARARGLAPWIGKNYAKPEKLKRLAEQLSL
jgi:NAD-dependent dihydropyrimidine dehydrogenase PreA subunit